MILNSLYHLLCNRRGRKGEREDGRKETRGIVIREPHSFFSECDFLWFAPVRFMMHVIAREEARRPKQTYHLQTKKQPPPPDFASYISVLLLSSRRNIQNDQYLFSRTKEKILIIKSEASDIRNRHSA